MQGLVPGTEDTAGNETGHLRWQKRATRKMKFGEEHMPEGGLGLGLKLDV